MRINFYSDHFYKTKITETITSEPNAACRVTTHPMEDLPFDIDPYTDPRIC